MTAGFPNTIKENKPPMYQDIVITNKNENSSTVTVTNFIKFIMGQKARYMKKEVYDDETVKFLNKKRQEDKDLQKDIDSLQRMEIVQRKVISKHFDRKFKAKTIKERSVANELLQGDENTLAELEEEIKILKEERSKIEREMNERKARYAQKNHTLSASTQAIVQYTAQYAVQAVGQMPIQEPVQIPVQSPFDTPFKPPFKRPYKLPFQTPMQTPFQTAVQSPIEIPLQISVEKPVPYTIPVQTYNLLPTGDSRTRRIINYKAED